MKQTNVIYNNEFVNRYMERLAEMGFPASSHAEAKRNVAAFISVMQDGLLDHEAISFHRFGRFEIRHRRSRMGRDMQINKPIEIPASDTVGFKPSKVFRKHLNNK